MIEFRHSIIGQFFEKLVVTLDNDRRPVKNIWPMMAAQSDPGVANLQHLDFIQASRCSFLEKPKKTIQVLQICNTSIGQFFKKLADRAVASFLGQIWIKTKTKSSYDEPARRSFLRRIGRPVEVAEPDRRPVFQKTGR